MSEPDWSLLPQEPLKFFELADNFGRTELKRAYGRLIKRFKPETSPNEFRKIRDAYERLEVWLKYREPAAETPANLPEGGPIEISLELPQGKPEIIEQTSVPPSPADQPAPRLAERSLPLPAASEELKPSMEEILQQNSPAQWYKQLSGQTEKTAEDFVRLAFLSDVVENSGPDGFLTWLCRGLEAFPDDEGLIQLTYGYCRKEKTLAETAAQLPLLCRALPLRRLMYVTDPLWEKLLKQNFPQFKQLWEQYIHPQRDLQAVFVVPFLVQALPAAVWVADDDWLADQLQFVESHHELIYHQHDYQLELYQILSEYHHLYQLLQLSQPELLERLDWWHQQIREYCQGDAATRHEKFAASQLELLRTFPSWSQKFRLGDKTGYQHQLARTWEWISLYDRLATGQTKSHIPDHQATRCSRDWLYQLPAAGIRYTYPLFSLALIVPVVLGLSSLLCYSLCLLLINLFTNQSWREANDIALPIGMIVSWILTGIGTLLIWKALKNRAALKYYLQDIRPRAAQFFRSSRVLHWQFCAAMGEWLSAENKWLKNHHRLIAQQMEHDPALMIYRDALDYEV